VGRVGRRAQQRERGAALVEAAILLPVLLVLIFGAIEYGFLFKDASTVAGAVRSGARIASTESKVDGMAADAANGVATAIRNFQHTPSPVIWVYLSGDNGYPLGTTGFSSCAAPTCVVFTTHWDNAAGSFVLDNATQKIPASQEHVCPSDSASTWSRVGVYVRVNRAATITNLVPAPKVLTDHAVFRMEPVQSVQCPPAS
jgi:hypothetical protein